MKEFLFDSISNLGELLLDAIQAVARFLLTIQINTSNLFISIVANIFKYILMLIDKDRVHHAQQVVEQESMANELEILMHVSKVKEDALSRASWTNDHSIALNQLSQKLYNECEWSKERIHEYMRAIVETIPGLTYVAGEDDDDEDDDITINY